METTRPIVKRPYVRRQTVTADLSLDHLLSAPLKNVRKASRTLSGMLVAIGLAGAIFFAANLYQPATPPPVYGLPAPSITQSGVELNSSPPVSLRIPDVGISAEVIEVGLNTSDNSIQVPSSFEKAGWYSGSPTPGEVGASVIVGHVDSYQGPAVFWDLSRLLPGQTVEVTRDDGSTAKFTVSEVKQFDQNNFPSEEVYGETDSADLRLITCGGVFNRDTGRYTHNTVVYATLVD